MATLVVRKVDDEVARRLKERAKAAGRSAEAEHRVILEDALRPRRTGWDLFRELREMYPLLDDDDEFFKALESLDEPAGIVEFPE